MDTKHVLDYLRKQCGPDRPPQPEPAVRRMEAAGLEPRHVGWVQWLLVTERISDRRRDG